MCENVKQYTTPDGRSVDIRIDGFGERITVLDWLGQEIGSIIFSLREDEYSDCYKITWMYLDKKGRGYLRQGIGRAALQFHKEIFNANIEASNNDGIMRIDGSHLTGDAPGFISKMRQEGFVFSPSHVSEDDDT